MAHTNPFYKAGYLDVLAVDPVLCLNCGEQTPACKWTFIGGFDLFRGSVKDVQCPRCGYSYAKIAEIKEEWGFNEPDTL